MPPRSAILHASAIAVAGRGCLIVGAAGAGKSTLAIEMIAAGAALVADDRTDIRRDGNRLTLSAPQTIAGRIEACGAGLLTLPYTSAPLHLIVDLDRAAGRLPPRRYRHLLGVATPVILGRGREGLAAILRLGLLYGLQIPD